MSDFAYLQTLHNYLLISILNLVRVIIYTELARSVKRGLKYSKNKQNVCNQGLDISSLYEYRPIDDVNNTPPNVSNVTVTCKCQPIKTVLQVLVEFILHKCFFIISGNGQSKF